MDEEKDIIEVEAVETEPPEQEAAEQKSEEQSCKFCCACGRKLKIDAAFCDGCGRGQNEQMKGVDFEYRQKKTYKPEKINDIIGKERAYYSSAFEQLKYSPYGASWNWYSCLGWLWYAYRKMPVEAVVFFAAFQVLGFVPYIGFALQLGLIAANGAFGNYIYLKHVERTIDRIEALPVTMRTNAVKEYGGVSGLMLVIAFLISGGLVSGTGFVKHIAARPYSNLPKNFWTIFRF